MCRTLRGSTTAHGVIFTATTKKKEPNSIPSVHIDILLQALMHMNNKKKGTYIYVWKILIINQKTLTKLFLGNKWQIKG